MLSVFSSRDEGRLRFLASTPPAGGGRAPHPLPHLALTFDFSDSKGTSGEIKPSRAEVFLSCSFCWGNRLRMAVVSQWRLLQSQQEERGAEEAFHKKTSFPSLSGAEQILSCLQQFGCRRTADRRSMKSYIYAVFSLPACLRSVSTCSDGNVSIPGHISCRVPSFS